MGIINNDGWWEIKGEGTDESSSKKSDSNFNGCGQDITEEYLKSE